MISNISKKYKVLLYGVISILILVSLWMMYANRIIESDDPFTTAPENTEWVVIDGNQIAYQHFPSESEESILLIGGTTAWSGVWRDTVDDLNKEYEIYTLDLPPFGYTTMTKDYTYNLQNQARIINKFLDELQVQDVILVAHSYGAGPSMEAVFMNQENFEKLVVIDGAIHVNRDTSRISSVTQYVFSPHTLRYFMSSIALHFPGFTEMSLKYLVHDNSTVNKFWIDVYNQPLSTENTSRDIAKWFYDFVFRNGVGLSSTGDNYQALNVPVGIIWGKEDTFTPLEQGIYLDSIIPESSLTVMEAVGHIPMIDDHQAYIETLKTHLK